MTSRPAVPESETMVQRINAQFEECCDVGGHWDRMRDIALEVAATLLGELNFTYQRAEQAEKRCDLAQTEIKGHMRVKDDLQVELDAHKTVIGLLFDSLPECPRMGDLPEYVDDLKARIAELEKVARRVVEASDRDTKKGLSQQVAIENFTDSRPEEIEYIEAHLALLEAIGQLDEALKSRA